MIRAHLEKRRCRFLFFMLFAIVGIAISLPAKAQAKNNLDKVSRVEELYVEGAALYKVRKYRQAIIKFKKAYAILPEPNLLYNIARCYEAAGEIESAMKSYKLFIDHKDADLETRAKASARYEMLQRAEIHSRVSKTEQPGGKSLERVSITPKNTKQDEKEGTVTGTLKWVFGSAGLAAIIAGSVLVGIGDQGDHKKIDDALSSPTTAGTINAITRTRAMELYDSGNTKKKYGYIMWGIGSAALIASIVLFFMDSDTSKAERRKKENQSAFNISLAPLLDGGSVMLDGRF